MSFKLKESVGVCAIALLNGYFVYPKVKQLYRTYYSLKLPAGDPTHYVYMDLEVEGKDIGRVDFELFGNSAPKTVNNFLGFVTGDFSPYMRYKGSYFQQIVEQRFITGGDFVRQDGLGSATVYPDTTTIPSEKNDLKFSEAYLLAMSADKDGNTGCQFFITLQEAPCLDGTSHTIIGRMIKGRETLNIVEGLEEYRKVRGIIQEKIKTMPGSMGFAMQPKNQQKPKLDAPQKRTRVMIRDCGVYKFEQSGSQRKQTSASNKFDFKPIDFLQSRQNR